MKLNKLFLCTSLLGTLLLLSGFSEVRHIGTEKTSQLFCSSEERQKCLGKAQAAILDELGAPSFSNKESWYYVKFDVLDVLGVKRIKKVKGIVLHFDQNAKVDSVDSFQNKGGNHRFIRCADKDAAKMLNPFRDNFFKTLVAHPATKKSGALPPGE